MSFLSDLVEGNWNNLGTDISHAPESAVTDYRSEWVPAAAIGATALTAGILGPELLPLAGADVAAGSAEAGLGAASAEFGAFDPAVFAAESADVGAGIGTAETAAGTLAGADIAAGDLGAASSLAFDPAAAAGGDALAFLPGDPVSGLATDATAGAFADPTAIGAGGGGLYGDIPVDSSGFLTQDLGGGYATDATQAADLATTGNVPLPQPDPRLATTAAGAVGDGGYGAESAALAGGNPTLGAAGPAATSAAGGGGFFGQGGIAGTGISGGQALIAGAALAPLALALGRGEAQLPSSAQQAQSNAAVLSQFGQQNINGQLNAGQLASLQVMQQDLTNKWRQTLYNQGVTDLSKDSRWPQIQAQIDTQVTAATSQMITANISQALTALGSAGTQLNQIAAMQMQADSNFTNTLVNATKSLGLLAGTNFAGGKSSQQAAA
jgi:hypothetical protein